MTNRNLSLDVLRGITVTLMIVVNTPGNHATTFAPLHHAKWHGFTPTDWVFPTFMFVVGNVLAFNLNKYEALGDAAFLRKIVKRAAIIFLLGFLMYWFPFIKEQDGHTVFKPLSETRIFGVLQRIALGYLFASLILHFWKEKGAMIFSIIALLGYWLLLFAFGDYSLEENAVRKLDLFLFGEKHLYHGNGIAFDPEGLLSTIPAIVSVIGGYFAGRLIRQKGNTYETISKLMVPGALLIFVALCWNMVFPINKKIWTSPFVLYTMGIDLLILAILIFVIEIKNEKRGTYFFEVFGRNTLFLYLLSEIGLVFLWVLKIDDQPLFIWLNKNVFALAGDYVGSLLFALWWMLVCWLVGFWMDKKKVYIKV
ncbi:MAG TPA: heparan-alpha-glucosaminide N-acetyltransferase domain-containing protein [Cyclobacteriaceae bacterium]|nr:heparan-alpha-glucosaminide N-acetyltransferase domain-containing protein [Cyclobacteriaceae bacterium]